jgi:hypothetical protein
VRRILIAALLAVVCAPAAEAQLFKRVIPNNPPVASPPAKLPPNEADVWPYPVPDPKSWWTDERLKVPEAANPLGGRRVAHGQALLRIDNGIDASTYRLWGLMPLQWQILYPGEMVLEVWVRPATSVRQSVVRITVRRDGKAFVQGRAGIACCEADIARRVGFDAELPQGSAQAFLALRDNPMWRTPRLVRVSRKDEAEGLCVDGLSYDLTLVLPDRVRSLHRACEDAEIGQAADALEPALRAALGHDPRFDVLFPGGIDFAAERKAYHELIAQGGALKADPAARAEPPGAEPAPREEPVTPAAAQPAPRSGSGRPAGPG